jgi:hypothetical protein
MLGHLPRNDKRNIVNSRLVYVQGNPSKCFETSLKRRQEAKKQVELRQKKIKIMQSMKDEYY